MTELKIMMQCHVCGGEFQFGPHRYDGKFIPGYKIHACRICYAGNWDGWNPDYEERLVEHLNEKGIPIPERNAKGWYPSHDHRGWRSPESNQSNIHNNRNKIHILVQKLVQIGKISSKLHNNFNSL
jgi:hypothetical protein